MKSEAEESPMVVDGDADVDVAVAAMRRTSHAEQLVPKVEAAKETTVVERVRARIFKIVVIGDSNVGKTCLTFRFCGGKFPVSTEATIGVDFRERSVEVDDELVKLQLWDTAGQERYHKGLTSHFYRNLHAVIFVYDVTRLSSFDNLHQWLAEYDRHKPYGSENVPRVLVGNKCDQSATLNFDTGDGSSSRVPTAMAQRFADAHGMPLFETSAKDDSEASNVEAIFMTLAHKLKHSSRPIMWVNPTPSAASQKKSRSFSGVITVHSDEGDPRYSSSQSRSTSSCC